MFLSQERGTWSMTSTVDVRPCTLRLSGMAFDNLVGLQLMNLWADWSRRLHFWNLETWKHRFGEKWSWKHFWNWRRFKKLLPMQIFRNGSKHCLQVSEVWHGRTCNFTIVFRHWKIAKSSKLLPSLQPVQPLYLISCHILRTMTDLIAFILHIMSDCKFTE